MDNANEIALYCICFTMNNYEGSSCHGISTSLSLLAIGCCIVTQYFGYNNTQIFSTVIILI